jgi:cholesterol transport system auxiliary component
MDTIMRERSRWWVLAVVLALGAGACAGMGETPERIDYYVLEYEPPSLPGLEPVDEVIRLERFSVAPSYNTERIVYRESAFQRDTYNYHRWRANPGDLVSYFVLRDLRRSGLFQAVLPQDTRLPATCSLEGIVEEFFERDSEERWEAVLTLSVTLLVEGEPDVSRRVLHQATYHEVEPAERKNPGAFTEAMSRATARVSTRILEDIHQALSRER